MDSKQYNYLKEKYDSTLASVYSGRYYRLSFEEFKDIISVLQYPLRKGELTCNSCRMRVLREIAKQYRDYVPEKKNKNKKK